MVKSPESGKPLLSTGTNSSDRIGALGTFCTHPGIQCIHQAVGSDASLHVVGGCIRDFLAGNDVQDIDLASKYPPDTLLPLLEQQNIKVVPSGIAHGTVLAVVDQCHIEITTFRKPGTRETHAFSDTIETDLSGRDFTINAMAYALDSQEFLDPYDGVSDLEANLLRTTGVARTRFEEDPLRILRMIRFGPAAGRHLEDQTLQAASDLAPLLSTVSIERIQQELSKILCCPHAGAAFRKMKDATILSVVLPELLPCVNCEQNEYHVEDVFEHTLTVLDRATRNLDVRLAALFHDSGKPATLSVDEDGRRHFYRHEEVSKDICTAVMKRLRYSNDRTRRVANLVGLHMRPLACGASGVRRIIRDTGEDLDLWLLLKTADKSPTLSESEFKTRYQSFQVLLQREYERQKDPIYGKLAITGKTLLAMGIPEGPLIGKILHSLDEELLEYPERNKPEYLKKRSKELYASLVTSS